MKIWFHEIKDEELQYSFTEETPWVMEIVASMDERVSSIPRPSHLPPRSRPTKISMTLRRVDELIHVQGRIETQLFLLCSLCAEAFPFPVERTFHALYTDNPEYGDQPTENSGQMEEPEFDDFGPGENTIELSEKEDDGSDFEVTVVKEPALDFKEVVHEQILLTLPMQPKPPKDDKDDCMKCGKPQKAWVAQEAPLKENPFAQVLKSWKKPN